MSTRNLPYSLGIMTFKNAFYDVAVILSKNSFLRSCRFVCDGKRTEKF